MAGFAAIDWAGMFTPDASLAESFLRGTVVYLSIIILFRVVLRRQGGLERMPATGLPVGLLAGRGYTEQQSQLAAGDLLVFYTDGCVEAENERGEMFGMERLDALLLDPVGSADPLHRIEKALIDYRGKSEPSDDATLMTVKVG